MAIVCKSCFDQKFNEWKKPFDQNVNDFEVLPPYNEEGQHFSIIDEQEIISKLSNGEMMEVLCGICKKTHIGKDENGIGKVRYVGGNWETFQ